MATRLKTVNYAFPVLLSLVNNTLTNLTQKNLFIPESGAKTFRSAILTVSMDDIITATGGTITTKNIGLRLGAAAYTTINNASAVTHTGENISLFISQDFTSHFQTNWAGTSMTCDVQLQINQSTGTTLNMVNVCASLEITYEYDDAAPTHLKTVFIPLNAPVGSLTTAAVTYDTIPALNTFLPEASKVFRDIHVIVQGNTALAAATTSHAITVNVGSVTQTSGSLSGSLASSRWSRFILALSNVYPDTAVAQAFQLACSVANRCNHLQAYLVVTYEFDPAASTSIMNSLMLPMSMEGPIQGSVAADFTRTEKELWIEEPGPIAVQNTAFFPFWIPAQSISGLNMRIGTGAFVTYTDAVTTVCGSNGAMVRNDAAFTLARGKNVLNFDAHATSATNIGFGFTGFWLINYTSGKASQGVGAHNHSVFWNVQQVGTFGANNLFGVAAAPIIPEANYFFNGICCALGLMTTNTVAPNGVNINVERLAGEPGGHTWYDAYTDTHQNDAEAGYVLVYADLDKKVYDQFPQDVRLGRLDIEVSRRWRIYFTTGSNGATAFAGISALLNYHSITFSAGGNITNSAGGTVNINLVDATTGERLQTTSRIGNGAYNFTHYDNTALIFTEARESSTLLGRSDNGVAV